MSLRIFSRRAAVAFAPPKCVQRLPRPAAAGRRPLSVVAQQQQQPQQRQQQQQQQDGGSNGGGWWSNSSRTARYTILFGAAGLAGMAYGFLGSSEADAAGSGSVDWNAVRADIAALLEDSKLEYDGHGSFGPVLIRLAWHASGTFDKVSGTGGSDGATMRFVPECAHAANAGLKVARDRLEPIKTKYPAASYADIWTLAGVVAIEEMGGPTVAWKPGRTDKPDGSSCPPDGRLPDAGKGSSHIRDIFYRMGFNDREIVALVGAHAVGKCHRDRSGYDGPWTRAPTTFSNEYFRVLLDEKWEKRAWNGPEQYANPAGDLMMLPADMSLAWDSSFRKYVELYAKDEKAFFEDFAAAFAKLLDLGVKRDSK